MEVFLKPYSLCQGRFSLLQELGFGATASVHLAMDHQRNSLCAVKILSPSYLRSPEALPRMRREFKALSKLQNKHIINIYDIFEEPPFFSMEFISGLSLYQWVEHKGKIPEDKLLFLAKTLTQTLGECHDHGIIHRDLKPSNIIMAAHDRPVLVDFGMMRVEDGTPITATGIAIGTIGYIAPEQLDNAKSADNRSDIFSLGVSLLCLATALPPINTTKLLEEAEKTLSRSFVRILMRMTLTQPIHRPQSIHKVYEQLCRLQPSHHSNVNLFIPFEQNNHNLQDISTFVPKK